MRWMVLAVALWVAGCSVYDDDRVRAPGQLAPAASGSAAFLPPSLDAASLDAAAPSGEPCVLRPSLDYCAALPALPRAPVIDGVLECGLALSPIQPLGWQGPSAAPDKRAHVAAAWHADGLYAYVEVRGGPVVPHPAEEPVFCGDAVELYVDADAVSDDEGRYDATGTMQFVVAAPRADAPRDAVDAWRFTQGVSQGAWISKAVRATPLADGYSVEALVTAADLGLWEWNPSERLGFSVAIDVAGVPAASPPSEAGCSVGSGQFFLRLGDPRGSCPGEPWCDATAFCAASLLE